jgi:hypothetical protein
MLVILQKGTKNVYAIYGKYHVIMLYLPYPNCLHL